MLPTGNCSHHGIMGGGVRGRGGVTRQDTKQGGLKVVKGGEHMSKITKK